MADTASPIPLSFMTLQELADRASVSRGTLYNLVREGALPAPSRISRARVAIPRHVAEAWLAAKAGIPAAEAA